MLSIVLVEPQNAGNIGAVARVMDNFGFDELVMVNPRTDHLDKEAMDRACHAKKILEKASIKKNLGFLKDFDLVIGSTGLIGTDYNLLRTAVSCTEISPVLKKAKGKKVAMIFGREDSGLKNSELEKCDFVVTIPTSKDNRALNLSHAVSIFCYEASKVYLNDSIISHFNKPIKAEKEVLNKTIKEAVDKLEFITPTKKKTAETVLTRVISKAVPSKRELLALIGFFKKIK